MSTSSVNNGRCCAAESPAQIAKSPASITTVEKKVRFIPDSPRDTINYKAETTNQTSTVLFPALFFRIRARRFRRVRHGPDNLPFNSAIKVGLTYVYLLQV